MAEAYWEGAMQIHQSCFLQLYRSAENGSPQSPPKNMEQRFAPPPVARSKTPPRPLREALRVLMEKPGWEGGYHFGSGWGGIPQRSQRCIGRGEKRPTSEPFSTTALVNWIGITENNP